jgi:hypothetical protein
VFSTVVTIPVSAPFQGDPNRMFELAKIDVGAMTSEQANKRTSEQMVHWLHPPIIISPDFPFVFATLSQPHPAFKLSFTLCFVYVYIHVYVDICLSFDFLSPHCILLATNNHVKQASRLIPPHPNLVLFNQLQRPCEILFSPPYVETGASGFHFPTFDCELYMFSWPPESSSSY